MTLTIAGLVPAYNPGPNLITLTDELARQVGTVVVVDDGSTTGADILAEVGTRHTLVRQDNRGIGGALNRGLAVIRDLGGIDAVLTLDQDSRLPEGYAGAAGHALVEAAAAGLPVAFVTAASYAGHPIPTAGRLGRFDIARDPMQSGCLVPLSTVDRCGDFAADFVIDAVDSEFTARCRAAGLRPLVAPGAALDHLMGTSVEARFLGRPVRRHGEVMQVNAHASVRVYYMTRNSLLLARRHFRADPAWTLRRLAEEATAHAIRLGVGPHKGADARAIALGVRDALRSRTGPAPLGLRGAAGPRR